MTQKDDVEINPKSKNKINIDDLIIKEVDRSIDMRGRIESKAVGSMSAVALILNVVLNFTKENKLKNNSDGWARKIEFLENGIKRTKYQDADNNLLFYKSEMVVKILDVEQGSIAKNEGMQKGDIVLCLGAFDYFANGSEGDFEKNSSQELKEAVIYNPISKKIVKSQYTDSFGISFNYSYSEENAISEMKTIYDNWIKNNPQN